MVQLPRAGERVRKQWLVPSPKPYGGSTVWMRKRHLSVRKHDAQKIKMRGGLHLVPRRGGKRRRKPRLPCSPMRSSAPKPNSKHHHGRDDAPLDIGEGVAQLLVALAHGQVWGGMNAGLPRGLFQHFAEVANGQRCVVFAVDDLQAGIGQQRLHLLWRDEVTGVG